MQSCSNSSYKSYVFGLCYLYNSFLAFLALMTRSLGILFFNIIHHSIYRGKMDTFSSFSNLVPWQNPQMLESEYTSISLKVKDEMNPTKPCWAFQSCPWACCCCCAEVQLSQNHPFTCQKIFPPPGDLQFWCFKTPHEVLNSMLTPARLMSGCQITDAGLGFYPCWEMNRIWRSGKWERAVSSFSPALISAFTPHVRLWTKWLLINFQFEIIKLMQVLKGFYF